MTNRQQQIFDIKTSTNILDYITTPLELCSSGNHEYEGPCPFCGGKDRFHVQPYATRGPRWFCRQCTGDIGADGKWQDIFDFIQKEKNISFNQAFEYLAKEQGVNNKAQNKQAHYHEPRPVNDFTTDPWQHQKQALVHDTHDRLINWPHDDTAKKVAEYLANRGIEKEMQRKYKLGAGNFGMIRTKEKRNQPVNQSAVVIPWTIPFENENILTAVQYRFTGPQLDPHDNQTIIDQRYGSLGGSRRILFGAQFCSSLAHTLILTEGEFNAISIDQVINSEEGAGTSIDVVSWGSQANIKNTFVQSKLLHLIQQNGYTRIVCWADKIKYAAGILTILEKVEHDLNSVSIVSTQQDPNQMLINNPSGQYLKEYLESVIYN